MTLVRFLKSDGTIDKEVEEAAYDAEVPSLILQPLVETQGGAIRAA